MIPLAFEATSEATTPFVTRLSAGRGALPTDSVQIGRSGTTTLWSGQHGLFEIRSRGQIIENDVVLVDPEGGSAERLIRAASDHNTLLVTERCDQLCVMCSQPPKKTHVDRFAHFEEACLLAPKGKTIGFSGGEPTLYLEELLALIENVAAKRPDLSFHILTNAQHFEDGHLDRLLNLPCEQVVWGIPLYSSNPDHHDIAVGKPGAFERLMESFSTLLLAGARIELRTVMMQQNIAGLPTLAHFITRYLSHIDQWSIMGLENIGFAKGRWDGLYCDLRENFKPIAEAIDIAVLFGVEPRLFNIPLCQIEEAYRDYAVASISDWKQRFNSACEACSAKPRCAGFFEWHPDHLVERVEPI